MRRLLIFLKAPASGQVKTRLAQAVGDAAAAAIYRACAELTLQRLSAFQYDAIIYVDPPKALETVRAWVGRQWTLLPQQGATLGDRLADATQQTFHLGAKHVVVVGTDSPWLRPTDIETAFAALETADVTLGPTEDGGYYLIGLSRHLPALFAQIPWSSSRVFRVTQTNAKTLGLRLSILPAGYDVDYVDDVRRFVEEEQRRGPLAPAVNTIAQWLKQGEPCHV